MPGSKKKHELYTECPRFNFELSVAKNSEYPAQFADLAKEPRIDFNALIAKYCPLVIDTEWLERELG